MKNVKNYFACIRIWIHLKSYRLSLKSQPMIPAIVFHPKQHRSYWKLLKNVCNLIGTNASWECKSKP